MTNSAKLTFVFINKPYLTNLNYLQWLEKVQIEEFHPKFVRLESFGFQI